MLDCLATLSMYNDSIPTDALVTDVIIESNLMVASGVIRDYLFRELTLKEYSKWFTLDGLGQRELFLPEWPVVAVNITGSPMAFGTLYYRLADSIATNNAFPTYSSNTNGITLNWFSSGIKSTVSYTFADYPTYGDLVTAIQLNNGWTVSYDAAQWAGAPTIFLRPVESQLCVQGVILESVCYVNSASRLIDEYTLELTGNMGRWVYCSWRAGYDLPTEGHRGNLPIAISQACVNLARDIITLGQNSGGLVKDQQSLKDWSYSVSIGDVKINELVERQFYLLSRYRRMGII
jgi:hypothetical protein